MGPVGGGLGGVGALGAGWEVAEYVVGLPQTTQHGPVTAGVKGGVRGFSREKEDRLFHG